MLLQLLVGAAPPVNWRLCAAAGRSAQPRQGTNTMEHNIKVQQVCACCARVPSQLSALCLLWWHNNHTMRTECTSVQTNQTERPTPRTAPHGCSRCTCSAWAGHQAAACSDDPPLLNTQGCTRSATNLNILARSQIFTSSEHLVRTHGAAGHPATEPTYCTAVANRKMPCKTDRDAAPAALQHFTPHT